MHHNNVRGHMDFGLYITVRAANVLGVELGSLVVKVAHTGDHHYRWIPVAFVGDFLVPVMAGDEPRECPGYEEQALVVLQKMQHRRLLAGMPVALSVESKEKLKRILADHFALQGSKVGSKALKVGDWVVRINADGEDEQILQQVHSIEAISGVPTVTGVYSQGELLSVSIPTAALVKVKQPRKGKKLALNGNVKPPKASKSKGDE